MIIRKIFKFVKTIVLVAILGTLGLFYFSMCKTDNSVGDTIHVEIPAIDIKAPEINLDKNPAISYVENMMVNYDKVSRAKIGTKVKCPVCGWEYTVVETDGYHCCTRRCERAYRDIKNTYLSYKDGETSLAELKELIEDYLDKLVVKQ